ncbi:hypothetical protein D9M72_344490 [compost metagenome]
MGRGSQCGSDVHPFARLRTSLAEVRHGRQQRLGVLMPGVAEDLLGSSGLNNQPLPHHGDPVGKVRHHPHVMGNQHNGAVQLVPQVAHEVKDFGLDRHVQGRGGLVGNQEFGVAGQ